MNNNIPAHIHNSHNIPCKKIEFKKFVWPANSWDLTLIKPIWIELKDKLCDHIGSESEFVISAESLSWYMFLRCNFLSFISNLLT